MNAIRSMITVRVYPLTTKSEDELEDRDCDQSWALEGELQEILIGCPAGEFSIKDKQSNSPICSRNRSVFSDLLHPCTYPPTPSIGVAREYPYQSPTYMSLQPIQSQKEEFSLTVSLILYGIPMIPAPMILFAMFSYAEGSAHKAQIGNKL